MVMPNSVRLMAAVTGAVFVWLFVQIFRNPGNANAPSKDAHISDEVFKDPMLDRRSTTPSRYLHILTSYSYGRASRASLESQI